MIEYAAGDVTSLIPEVYETQKRYYNINEVYGHVKIHFTK